MALQAIVVDDEPLGRARIIKLLEGYGDIHVVAQCRNGREAVELIQRERPDLVFLDIQMPDMDGFSVLRKLDMSRLPVVVFATAHDQYALKAFDAHAIDYLLKPFDRRRFREAIDRARSQIALQKSSELNERLRRLLADDARECDDAAPAFHVKHDGHVVTVAEDDLYWIEAHGNYVALHLRHETYLYRATLNGVASDVGGRFLRIHRSCAINTRHIQYVKYAGAKRYRFVLTNDTVLISSRSYRDSIVETLTRLQSRPGRGSFDAADSLRK